MCRPMTRSRSRYSGGGYRRVAERARPAVRPLGWRILTALRLATPSGPLPFNHTAQAEAMEGWRRKLSGDRPHLGTELEMKRGDARAGRDAGPP